MRIGNLEDLDRSKKPNTIEEPVSVAMPEETRQQKNHKKWKNWWYYHKWYVVCGIILLGITINIAGNYLGLWTRTPDFQIAYVGKSELPQDTVDALKQAFASIASDFNGDGEVVVQVNQYIDGSFSPDAETAYFEYASEISLIGDISNCESYFFLMDNPELFQREFQILASFDGSCPADADYTFEDKVIAWSNCPILSGQDLGAYSDALLGEPLSGSNQDLLSGLYLGRRCFYTDSQTDHAEQCSNLWDALYHSLP